MSLRDLKTFNAETISLEEAVALSVEARALRTGFENAGVEIPAWLDEKNRQLNRYIESAKSDMLDKRTREIKAQLSGLETTSEKRERLKAELAALESKPTETAK